MTLGTLALLANEAESGLAESGLAESENVVPLPAWVYGLTALVILLLLLLVVTRLDLDR